MAKVKQAIRTTDLPLYSYWRALYAAFFSRAVYQDVAKRWKGFGYRYLIFAILLFSLPMSLRLSFELNQFFKQQILFPIKNLPNLLLQNGELRFDKTMPYPIHNQLGKLVGYVDTRAPLMADQLFSQNPDLMILVGKHRLYYRAPKPDFYILKSFPRADNPLQAYDFKSSDTEIFTAADWMKNSGILAVKNVLLILVYPLVALAIFFLYLGFIVIFAMLGQLIAYMLFKLKLNFKESSRLFSVALTAQLLFFICMLTLNLHLPFQGIINMSLASAYYFFAVLAVKRDRSRMVRQ